MEVIIECLSHLSTYSWWRIDEEITPSDSRTWSLCDASPNSCGWITIWSASCSQVCTRATDHTLEDTHSIRFTGRNARSQSIAHWASPSSKCCTVVGVTRNKNLGTKVRLESQGWADHSKGLEVESCSKSHETGATDFGFFGDIFKFVTPKIFRFGVEDCTS